MTMKRTFEQMLAAARQYPLLTEEEFAGYGGAFFDEEMGLHVGQDASRDDDIGGIVPFAWQMEYCWGNPADRGDEGTIRELFVALGRGEDIEKYDDLQEYNLKHRSKWGYKE